jgi:arginyl-tRNA synthetase
MGFKKDKLEVLVQQMVKLVKDGKEFKMSKRTGNSLTAEDMFKSIGVDAVR